MKFEDFSKNQMIMDATIRNFEIVGEAAKHIPETITTKYPNIPWQKMYGLRNLISHVYFGIDIEMIWEIITAELPQNLEDLAHLIEIEFKNQ